jgi:hypothetical protein
MMGERVPQKQLWNYQVNLDKRVRSGHPLRRIKETMDILSVSEGSIVIEDKG